MSRQAEPVRVKLDPAAGTSVTLTLDRAFPAEVPKETPTHRYLAIPSKLLSDFHGRPMAYRVGVVLPPNFDQQPDKRYGLIVDIGGFGTSQTGNGTFTQDNGSVTVGSNLVIGFASGGAVNTGLYELKGGTLSLAKATAGSQTILAIGNGSGGSGTITQTGGTLDVNIRGDRTDSIIDIGRGGAAAGIYTLSGAGVLA